MPFSLMMARSLLAQKKRAVCETLHQKLTGLLQAGKIETGCGSSLNPYLQNGCRYGCDLRQKLI